MKPRIHPAYFYRTAMAQFRQNAAAQKKLSVLASAPVAARAAYASIAAFYIPTLHDLLLNRWLAADQVHHLFVAIAIAALAWQQGKTFHVAVQNPRTGTGSLILAIGLLLFVAGRSLGFLSLEVGSAIPLLLGTMLVINGAEAVRTFWLPISFLAFLIPVPEMIAEASTAPFKTLTSEWAANLLYKLGYPVARSGVVLTIGKYQLLVADACAGMRSIISLYALALVYLRFRANSTWPEIICLLLAILPIAVLANFIRVMSLLLLVFYRGESAIQGAFHASSGLVLLALSVMLFMALDRLIQRIRRRATADFHMAPRDINFIPDRSLPVQFAHADMGNRKTQHEHP